MHSPCIILSARGETIAARGGGPDMVVMLGLGNQLYCYSRSSGTIFEGRVWVGGASMTRDGDATPQIFLCLQAVTENVFPLSSLRSGDGNSLLEYCTERKIQISGLVVFILTGNGTLHFQDI